jgi:hypothetical protein
LNWKLLLSGVFVCGLLLGAVSYATVNSLVQIKNIGTIRAIGVEIYAEQSLTTVLIEVSWGTLDPGGAKTVDVWIKNTGTDPQKLVLWTENWNPTAAQNSIALAWNYMDQWIPANASIPVTFTLTVDSNITGVTSFSFDIWVKGVH